MGMLDWYEPDAAEAVMPPPWMVLDIVSNHGCVVLQMHQTDMLDWDEPDTAEAAMPPPQMVLDIVSNDVLQLTVTKAALDVFNSLSRVC